ncbi:MAG: CDP-diacylglycerol--serine O-phosphatidyltransferase [Rhodothermaceae bacterium]|nr:CDP-diacylglycerol--serine O-phosphatidyltransferase [Rhodothermaceae bacterium]MYC03872.1 CDP-diacylglycerol--serine O-phosphatidyltransferase [Rhodothermaceae bacterium]MYI16624.1 CDP-diacylglycerol--serine O-phosphatidyltransferase [Rhodothermaceae bacterium]
MGMPMSDRKRSIKLSSSHRSTESRSGGSQIRQGSRTSVAVPSFFTLMNLFCGFVAITQIHQGQFVYACYLIILAGLFDLLDGMAARLTRGVSLFGAELDSLCDVVSFGVAPAYLIYARMLEGSGMFGLIISALPAMCSAVRLARFNLQFSEEKKLDFEGLPTPVQAYCIVAIVLNIDQETWLLRSGILDTEVLIPVVVLLSFLMVSLIRFDGVPRISFDYLRQYPIASGAYIISVLLIGFLPYTGLLLVLLVYVLIGLTRASTRSIRALMALPK